MAKWTISKDFNFCFGHRVWSQDLVGEFSENMPCKCRHLHGHEAKVTVHLTGDTLNKGMVTDFNHLAWFKTFLDKTLDHKFVLDVSDPLFGTLIPKLARKAPFIKVEGAPASVLDLSEFAEGSPEFEYLESFVLVDFVPTSENFSKWLYEIVEVKMAKLGVSISSLEWWESPKSRSVYSKE